MSEQCTPHHDWVAGILTAFLSYGLIFSYIPQHYRIINKKSSEGFSPWFLFLGSTSAASAMLNIISLQWDVISCCKVLSLGNCLEVTGGVLMVGMQWFLFSVTFVLYMLYYPPHLKYASPAAEHPETGTATPPPGKPAALSQHWRLSIQLALLTLAHLTTIISVSLFRLLTDRPVAQWATLLGVSSATLAAVQYLPQLAHTFRARLVGALSIPTMLMQSPGSAFFVVSIALRPGTNWTSWITYAVSGTMQAALLVMCVAWKRRQRRLGIDDFGRALGGGVVVKDDNDNDEDGDVRVEEDARVEAADERTPLLPGR